MAAYILLRSRFYGHFLLFLLLAIGEAIWVVMKIFCLQRALIYEAQINWKPGTSFNQRLKDVNIQVICFYVGLNFLRFELLDNTMWKFWIFTQVLKEIVPGLVMEKRGCRKGNSRLLHIVLICVAVISFNPWCNRAGLFLTFGQSMILHNGCYLPVFPNPGIIYIRNASGRIDRIRCICQYMWFWIAG